MLNNVEDDFVVEPIPRELYYVQPSIVPKVVKERIGGYGSSVELVEGQVAPMPDLKIQTPVSCSAFTQKYHQAHRAIDLISDCSLSIYAAKTGIVTFVGLVESYGNKIEVDHGNGLYTFYGHLAAFEVSVGDKVLESQKIGTMGSTGNSTGAHLHFELINQGVRIDPELYLR